MGLFKSIQKAISKVNNVVNKVMEVTDPIGAKLKEVTETKSQATVNSLLGNLFGAPKATGGYDDLGGTTEAVPVSAATSDESIQTGKNKKINDAKQRRQGFSGGSTLLVDTDDENQKINKNTLLGM